MIVSGHSLPKWKGETAMSNFMWKNKQNMDNGIKPEVDRKVSQMPGREGADYGIEKDSIWAFEKKKITGTVQFRASIYQSESSFRKPRYYMEENNHEPYVGPQTTERIVKGEPTASAGTQNQVVQLYTTIRDEEGVYDTNQWTLSNNAAKPTMVFESMGTNLQNCAEIYKQTCTYDGNTICIFGLNKPNSNQNPDPDLKNVGNIISELYAEINKGYDDIIASATGQTQYNHLLYIFPFVWNEPVGLPKDAHYKMPMVDARLKIMTHAANVVEECNKKSGPTNKFLFRWIDGDARNDTSKDLSEVNLNQLANFEQATFITGIYDWEHESLDTENSMPVYHEFIQKLNEAEKELRESYHKVAKKCNKYNAVASNSYKPGYYFPETVLLMNQAAHAEMLSSSIYTQRGKQERESMRLAERITGTERPQNFFLFIPKLKAKKPIKHEFALSATNSDEISYLKPILSFFLEVPLSSSGTSGVPHEFIVALNNLRQSAFIDWYFVNTNLNNNWSQYFGHSTDEPAENATIEQLQCWFNAKRAKCATDLWNYLIGHDNLKNIREELNKELKKQKAQKK